MSRKQQRLAELRHTIREVRPEEAHRLARDGALFLDIREADELGAGVPEGAMHVGRAFLELRIEELAPETDRTIVLLCAGGARSLFAAESLRGLGFTDVRSLEGGFRAWLDEGLPTVTPSLGALDSTQRARYARHLAIPEVGEAGQRRLLAAQVVLVGAGGLGSPAALYLAAAGVGRLRIIDADTVSLSNLQRQILHSSERLGQAKSESARRTLNALNPDVEVEGVPERLDPRNVARLLAEADVVVDGTDNFASRYLINDACAAAGIPHVHGSIHRFEGQVSTFWPSRAHAPGPCYRCLFPSAPPADLAPNCATAGVLGVLPGVVGTLQAVEAIKLILGIGEPLVGRLLTYDALAARFSEWQIAPRNDCGTCGAGPAAAPEPDPACARS
ncbi:MAG: molybdopterin-synthase adenylyltransferase MoeB [Planctomycetota bacterium]|nr:molybdopterin-synthase adenylyltransferase MoeB [Planctomycetota bacterium]MDA0933120.1 molybdopterin-synthase adenylyltransferase MoeB [Planctomycetota bacterium]MDA1221507.1 molybdopterin-synthase adenylyltransferase MoeB [Planctomycetota bacterium]